MPGITFSWRFFCINNIFVSTGVVFQKIFALRTLYTESIAVMIKYVILQDPIRYEVIYV